MRYNDPVESMFNATMLREGVYVTITSSKETIPVFFRKNNDYDSQNDKITIFYYSLSPIKQGNLITYRTKTYLLLNQETEENDVYYKSSAIKCNGTIDLNDGRIMGIPCYAADLTGSAESGNLSMSIIGGNMEFITESNKITKQIKINDRFNEFGRTFEVKNLYHMDGIVHLLCSVSVNEIPKRVYAVTVSGLENVNYNTGDVAKLTVKLTLNGNQTTGTVRWESSDPKVASVDADGNVTFLTSGVVFFIAHWVEQSVSGKTIQVTVRQTTSPQPPKYTVDIVSKRYYVIAGGNPRTFTATLKDAFGTEQTGKWEWSYEYQYLQNIKFTPTDSTVSVGCNENEENVGLILKLTAKETTHNISVTKDIEMRGIV